VENNLYKNQLNSMLTDPNAFQGTPGFKFALNTGLDGIDRKMAAGGFSGSGNALAELTKYGTGLAQQDWGNQVDRLGHLSGQEDQLGLGQGQLANANRMTDNAFQQTANARENNLWNYDINKEQNSNMASNNQNNFNLGQQRNATDWYGAQTQRGTAESNAWNLGQRTQQDWEKYYKPIYNATYPARGG